MKFAVYSKLLFALIIFLVLLSSYGIGQANVLYNSDNVSLTLAVDSDKDESSAFEMIISLIWDGIGAIIGWCLGIVVKVVLWLLDIVTLGSIDVDSWYSNYEILFEVFWDWLGNFFAELLS